MFDEEHKKLIMRVEQIWQDVRKKVVINNLSVPKSGPKVYLMEVIQKKGNFISDVITIRERNYLYSNSWITAWVS